MDRYRRDLLAKASSGSELAVAVSGGGGQRLARAPVFLFGTPQEITVIRFHLDALPRVARED